MKLSVNGADVEVDDCFAASPLLWVLRDVLGMHGTKYGCGIGYCAACPVLIDGRNTALTNAIAAATRTRVRQLPITKTIRVC